MSNYKTVTAIYPLCERLKKMSFDKEKDERYTYCIVCRQAVLWKEFKALKERRKSYDRNRIFKSNKLDKS